MRRGIAALGAACLFALAGCVQETATSDQDAPGGARTDPVPAKAGTGFIVNDAGIVVTARHVVEGCAKVSTIKDGHVLPVKQSTIVKEMDIAILQTQVSTQSPAILETDNHLKAGEPVYFFDASTLRRNASDHPLVYNGFIDGDQSREAATFTIKGNAFPGDSGGPVLNSKGHVVGMVIQRQKYSQWVVAVTPVALKMALDFVKVPYSTSSANDGNALYEQSRASAVSVGILCLK
jgi:S1-C subfamily serine protease